MTKGVRKVFRGGKWEEGKAQPWLPPEHMRGLPQDLTTKDTTDPDRVHELDAPHIATDLAQQYADKQAKPSDAPKKYREAAVGENMPLSQEQVDFVRFRVIKSLIDSAVVVTQQGGVPDLSVRHLWFPHDNVNIYELRPGVAPLRSMRPKRLRNLDLEVDILEWPRRIKDILAEGGHPVPDPKKIRDDIFQRAAYARQLAASNDTASNPWE